MADKTKTQTKLGSPSDWMRRALCLPACHAARRVKINANDQSTNAQDGNKIRLTSRLTRNAISTGAVRQP
jgi:hypothetical protein